MKWDAGVINLSYIDMELFATANPLPFLQVGAGYRYVIVDTTYEQTALDVNITAGGPTLYAAMTW